MKEKQYESILVIVTGFLGLYLWLDIKECLILATTIAVMSLLSGWFRRNLLWLWQQLAMIIGYINSRILLTLVFYLMLTPLAFVRGLFSHSNTISETSTFRLRNHTYKAKDLENPW